MPARIAAHLDARGCAGTSACAPPFPPPPPCHPPGGQPGLGVRLRGDAHGWGGWRREGGALVRTRVHLSSAYIPNEASQTRTPGRAAPAPALPSLTIFSQPRQKIARQLEPAEQGLEFNRSSQPIDYWSCRVLTLPFFSPLLFLARPNKEGAHLTTLCRPEVLRGPGYVW